MYLPRRVVVQMAIFTTGTLVAVSVMAFHYMGLPNYLFGVGHYRVTLHLPAAAGLYSSGNVTYRGTEVGRVESVDLTDTGVDAVLSLKSGVAIPADLDAEVHSQTAVGEQFVALRPRSGNGPVLKDGDVINEDRASVPPDVNSLLAATNRGIQAIPHDNLKTVIDEGYTAVGGLGPELSRSGQGHHRRWPSTRARTSTALITLTDQSQPVLDSQTNTSDSIAAWAANIATVTGELKTQDPAVSKVLTDGPGAADATRALLDRLQPSLPVLLQNLVGLDQRRHHLQRQPRADSRAPAAGHLDSAGRRPGQPKHQAGLQGRLPVLQPQPQPAARMPHRLPTAAAAARSHRRGLSAAAGGQSVLPGAPGFAVQRARCSQHPVRDQTRQTRTHRGDVRKRRKLRTAQRRLQLEGRPQRHPLRATHSAAPAWHTGFRSDLAAAPPAACRRRSRSPSTTPTPAPTSGPTAAYTRRPTWPATPSKINRGRT